MQQNLKRIDESVDRELEMLRVDLKLIFVAHRKVVYKARHSAVSISWPSWMDREFCFEIGIESSFAV
jgi:hypothetical protein